MISPAPLPVSPFSGCRMVSAIPLFGNIRRDHPHLDHIADLELPPAGCLINRSRVREICTSPSSCTPMSTKAAEVDDVAHRARQLHAGLQVFQIQSHVGAQQGRRQLVAAGRARALQAPPRYPAGSARPRRSVLRQRLPMPHACLAAPVSSRCGPSVTSASVSRTASRSSLRRAVAFRVHGGVVQHIFRRPAPAGSRRTAQTPLARAWAPLSALAGYVKRAVFLPVGDDVFRHRWR